MFIRPRQQGIRVNFNHETYLDTWIDAFLVDRKAQGLSSGTLVFYRNKLKLFMRFCEGQVITQIDQISPGTIRLFLLTLEAEGHNPGGIHAAFRGLRTFLYWWEQETESEGWINPIRKVKPNRVPIEPLEPVSIDSVNKLLKTCIPKSFYNERDRAIFLCLLDTGARAQEFLSIDVSDVDLVSGKVLIRKGKGHKPRFVFIGKKSRRAVRSYLKMRLNKEAALWITGEGERLTYWGLRQVIRRRAKVADTPIPTIHSFRRAFAINMLRAGVDIYSLQSLMGHAGLEVLRRYLAQTTEDIAQAHKLGSPVDNSKM